MEFEEYWDEVIRKWREGKGVPESEAFWFEEQKHLHLLPNLMPEPYWGDIDNNSVVFVNFNPAGTEIENESDPSHLCRKDDQTSVAGYFSKNYSEQAKSFPLLNEMPIKYDGASWWNKRVEWKDSFGIENDPGCQPFAIELCAWHSKRWTGGKYNELRNPRTVAYIKNQFGPWLERAINGSRNHLALCIGAEFHKGIIPMIWPEAEDITEEVIDSGHKPIPNNSREYHVFRIPNVGHIVCTHVRGTNRLPSKRTFGAIEREIFTRIKGDSLS